jgi:hypothetical protein
MKTFEMERRKRVHLLDQSEHQSRPGSQLKHFRREVPLQSTVEALSVLDLHTGANSRLEREGVRETGWGNTGQYKQENRRAQQQSTAHSRSSYSAA